jgi:hypothetical protein
MNEARIQRRSLRGGATHAVALAALVLASVAAPKAAIARGVSSTVAEPCEGSSDPTLYPNNHRLLVTSSGRWLALFDPAGSGLQLAWRDGAGAWSTKSVFEGVTDEQTSDRPASIALDGRGHAWVVWSGYNFKAPLPLRLRRLTNLDAADGPALGPVVTVHPTGRGNAFADLAFRRGRGFIVWLQRKGKDSYALKAIEFKGLGSARPSFRHERTLYKGSSPYSAGTLVSTRAGMRIVAQAGRVKVFFRRPGARWKAGRDGAGAYEKARPSAVAFRRDILAAFPASENVVKVVRFTNKGTRARKSLVTHGGFAHASLASSDSKAWVVMVARAQRSVVSRRFNGFRWGRVVTELRANATNGGDYQYPNTVREAKRKLRFIVDAKQCPKIAIKNAVLAYQRSV